MTHMHLGFDNFIIISSKSNLNSFLYELCYSRLKCFKEGPFCSKLHIYLMLNTNTQSLIRFLQHVGPAWL